ncbi:hypothetical protein CXB51_000199 [Gossypium anomalum]|uniref:non-specific serine/threonine protein kinase n=1 Tax=Gossypium anomalum TaxID=47600 RepID=A0A8J5ZJP0_9ROSI|nr:hypothetical protein CXB51_000199 [Gossypium anomalum]
MAPPPVQASSPPNPHLVPPPPSAKSNSPSPPSYSSTSSSSPPSTPTLLTATSSSTSPSPPSTLSSSPSSPSSRTSPTTSTSKSPSSSSTRSSTSPSRKPSSNTNGNNQNNTTVTSPTPSPPPPPLSPPSSSSLSSSPPPLPANSPFENSLPNPSSTPILLSPPPTSNSSTNQIENTPKLFNMPFSSTLPIIIGVPVSVGIGNEANEHSVNIPVNPSRIVGKRGSPREESPLNLTPKYQSPLGINKCSFTYEELAIATQGFSQKNLLGQGGFGFVHKGVLPNGREVAVKSLKSGSGQGQREFQAEVEIISRIHHRHLVSLVGFSIAGDKKMLVYEFLPNKTLQFHLHDFGLAKLTQDSNTHVSTRVMGTFGYLAPEYVSSGKLTNKSDVFSFGVVLLELITGRQPYNPTLNMDESLVDWARPLCARAMEDGNFGQLVDPRLGNNFVNHEMASMIVRALEDGVPLDDLSETPKLDQSSTSNSKSDVTSNESSSYTSESKEYGSNNNDDTNHCHLNSSSFSNDSSETTSKAKDNFK